MRNFLLAGSGIDEAALLMEELFRKILGPVLAIIGLAAVGYAIFLGVQYAKAEDADARKKVQGRLIGALIGAVIIIAGMTLCFALDWVSIFTGFAEGTGADTSGITSPTATIRAILGR